MILHTDQPVTQDTADCWGCVDIVPYYVVRRNGSDLILRALWPLSTVLLAYDPNATMGMLLIIVRWIVSDHVLQALHTLQSFLKNLSELNEME